MRLFVSFAYTYNSYGDQRIANRIIDYEGEIDTEGDIMKLQLHLARLLSDKIRGEVTLIALWNLSAYGKRTLVVTGGLTIDGDFNM